jgi:hypothetical protein
MVTPSSAQKRKTMSEQIKQGAANDPLPGGLEPIVTDGHHPVYDPLADRIGEKSATRPQTRAEYEAEAEALIQGQLLNHEDEAVRAIAMITRPPAEVIARIADKLQSKETRQ